MRVCREGRGGVVCSKGQVENSAAKHSSRDGGGREGEDRVIREEVVSPAVVSCGDITIRVGFDLEIQVREPTLRVRKGDGEIEPGRTEGRDDEWE